MDLLHVPATAGAFEVEVNTYFSCDFALKHIEICDLETYAAPFMYREPTRALRRRKHMYMYVKQFEIFKGAFESLRNFRRLFEVAKMFKKLITIRKNHKKSSWRRYVWRLLFMYILTCSTFQFCGLQVFGAFPLNGGTILSTI